ncbi:AAA family ATPase [Gemmobacter lanyuensis]|uniref:AAA family ATPase n=1 Tax=Gemmobacter lanyuensis TaxID=1054497 RepID=UPI001674ED1A|nr:AAA family ATPase [Gemmobacter lanyuensis]
MVKGNRRRLAEGDKHVVFTYRVPVAEAVRSKPDPVDFVLPGLVAGSLGVVVAPGGVGKSMLMLQTAISIALGRDVYGIWSDGAACGIKSGPVILAMVEDAASIVKDRLHNACRSIDDQDLERLDRDLIILPYYGKGFSLIERRENGLAESGMFEALCDEIRKLPVPPRLVVFDTLNRCLNGASENSAGDVSQVINIVERLCADVGCAAVLVHHANKASMQSGNGSAQYAARGSSAITDNCRWQVNLSHADSEPSESRNNAGAAARVVLALAKVNYGAPLAPAFLTRDASGLLWGATPRDEHGRAGGPSLSVVERHDDNWS